MKPSMQPRSGPQGADQTTATTQETYFDSLLAFIQSRKYPKTEYPWNEPSTKPDHDVKLDFRTFLNEITAAASFPAETSNSERTKRTVSFAKPFEQIHHIEIGSPQRIRPPRRKAAKTRTRAIGVVCSCLPCKRLHRAKVTIIAPLEDSQIQWLAMLRGLQHVVRSWIKPVDWLQPAASNFPSERENFLIAFAYHLSLLCKDIKGIAKAIYKFGRLMLVVEERSSELLGCLETLRALKKNETTVAQSLSRKSRKFKGQMTDFCLKEAMEFVHNRHYDLEFSVRKALEDAELLQKKVERLKNMAMIAQTDLKALRDLLETENSEVPLCLDCFNQTSEIVDLAARSLKDVVIKTVKSDVYDLHRIPRLHAMGHLLKSCYGTGRFIQEIETLRNQTQTAKHRLQQWSGTLVDTEAHYCQMKCQQWNSAPEMRAD